MVHQQLRQPSLILCHTEGLVSASDNPLKYVILQLQPPLTLLPCVLLPFRLYWTLALKLRQQYAVQRGAGMLRADVGCDPAQLCYTMLPFTKVPFQKLCNCCTEEQLHGCHKPCPHQNYCTVVWGLPKLHTAYYQETYVPFWNRCHATLIRSLRLVRTLFPNVIPFSLLQMYEWTENTLAKY